MPKKKIVARPEKRNQPVSLQKLKMVDDDDERPETSPYASKTKTIQLQDAQLYIPNDALQQCPSLAAECDGGGCFGSDSLLSALSYETGHVVVHFLIAGTYQCLKPQKDSPDERNASEFATALRVRDIAAMLDLPSLSQLATNEVHKVGDELSLLSIIDIIEKEDYRLDRNRWVANYLTTRVQSVCRSLTRDSAATLITELNDSPTSVSKLILQSMVSVRYEELSSGGESRCKDDGEAVRLEFVQDKQSDEAKTEAARTPVQPVSHSAAFNQEPLPDRSFVFPKLDVSTSVPIKEPDSQASKAVASTPDGDGPELVIPKWKSKKVKKKEMRWKQLAKMAENARGALDMAGDPDHDISVITGSSDDSFHTGEFAPYCSVEYSSCGSWNDWDS